MIDLWKLRHDFFTEALIIKKLIMIKRTLCFSNPAYLSTRNEQLVIKYPKIEQDILSIPIEDIGFVVLEDPQITISNRLMEKLLQNNVGLVNCNSQRMPLGLFLPLQGHSEQNERVRAQLDATVPLKKNLWQQTVQAKIGNQSALLAKRDISNRNMQYWSKEVTSGDTLNHEARAAAYYWQHLFKVENFRRNRDGESPNNALNYGYAILRAVCARAIVSSGLLPIVGIHHANKYNAYCLADDIMEPYRPYVDAIVCSLLDAKTDLEEITTEIKKELLVIPVIDVQIEGKKSPLMLAMSRTTNSLQECFMGLSRKLIYPTFS